MVSLLAITQSLLFAQLTGEVGYALTSPSSTVASRTDEDANVGGAALVPRRQPL